MTQYSGTYTLDPDPMAWGSTVTADEARAWNDRMADRIEARFPGVTVEIGTVIGPQRHTVDEATADEINAFCDQEFGRVIEGRP